MAAPSTRHFTQLIPLTAPVLPGASGVSVQASRIPLDLFAEVITPDGSRRRWDANQAAGSRPTNLSFRTKLGEGFSDANLSLARRIDLDYPDLELVNDVVLVGADGSVAYEGRVSAMPRELGDSHSIGVSLTGWMAHAKDRKFTEIYIDRDMKAWGPGSRARQFALMTASQTPYDPSEAIDPSDSQSGMSTSFTGAWASPYMPISEAWYDAGPNNTIGLLAASWRREDATTVPTGGTWTWRTVLSSDDKFTSADFGSNLLAAGPGTTTQAASTPWRYAALQFFNTVSPGGSDGVHYGIAWYSIAVYGSHNLTRIAGEPGHPAGFKASDVIRDIAGRFCPRLNTVGVMDSSYVVQHVTFKERTYPYDAFLELNKYHLWHLGVWENKTLTFRPYDLRDYQWEIRTDDPGTTFSPQGPSTEDLFNGIVVVYTDLVTGQRNELVPDRNAELRDTSTTNPWNRAGVNHWDEIELSSPTLQEQALQLGRAALVDRNRPKAPGTITVRGYVRDRAGNQMPGWKVRAGDTIAITNFPNDRPRLIHETSWDDESKTVSLSIDAPAQAIDAVFDRIGLGLQARNLG